MTQVGDVGIAISGTLKDENGAAIPLSGATTLTLEALSPRGIPKIFTISGDANGNWSYTTQASDLPSGGDWHGQIHFVGPGEDWRSDVFRFRVEENLF